MISLPKYLGTIAIGLTWISQTFAWEYTGHRLVSEVAVRSLPEDMPAFAKTSEASEHVQYTSGEPDRWRNLPEAALRELNEPDHYLDYEEIYTHGLTPETLPQLRNELISKIYAEPNPDNEPFRYRTFGLLPYAIHENYLKLKSGFTYLKALETYYGTPAQKRHAQQNILYTMGILSHFVGDGAQPLHVTIHHHGWVGKNYRGYTRDPNIHSLIDGGIIKQAGITFTNMEAAIRPARLLNDEKLFTEIMTYLAETYKYMKPLYHLEKKGKFDPEKPDPEGIAFIEQRLLAGGQFLGDLYYSAYRSAQLKEYFYSTNAPASTIEVHK